MLDTETSQIEDAVKSAEFAFLVIKNKDGRFAIANVNNDDTERQPSMEDIYTALFSLQKDIDRQALAMAVASVVQQVSGNQSSASGLVLPEKKFVKRT